MANINYDLPYTDWTFLRNLGKGDTVQSVMKYRLYLGLLTEPYTFTTLNGKSCVVDPSKAPVLLFDDARRYASIALFKAATESKITPVKLSSESGTDLTLISKLKKSVDTATELSDVRPLSAPLISLYCLSRATSTQSLHFLLFGEPGKITLPNEEAALARYMDSISKKKLAEIYEYAKELSRTAETEAFQNSTDPNFVNYLKFDEYRPIHELLRERIGEVASMNEDMADCYCVFCRPHIKMPTAFKQHILSMYQEENNGDVTTKVAMLLAQESGQAIDFFVGNNYTITHNILIYYAAGKKTQILRGIVNRRLLGVYVSLPRKYKADLYGKIASEGILAKINTEK